MANILAGASNILLEQAKTQLMDSNQCMEQVCWTYCQNYAMLPTVWQYVQQAVPALSLRLQYALEQKNLESLLVFAEQ